LGVTISTFGALIHTDPDGARKQILDALTAARGDRSRAAKALGLKTARTLYRWIERLDMWPTVDALIAERGFDKLPAPPRTRDRVIAALAKHKGNVDRAARMLGLKPDAFRARLKRLNIDAKAHAPNHGGKV
jgi:transcriptional regulator with GAF, ATPase, and Fis domain